MLKDELEGERIRDLSLNVLEVSSSEVGAAIAPVRRAIRHRMGFIFCVDINLTVSEDSACGDGSCACMWRPGMVLRA